ncbi:MAG: type II toxin-antitoxin system VapC family toxin [Acidobacteria bacterium]|nr:type II toxin-antitoxin system VapC family toxin [Acidobacteriota bacterium]
MVLYLDTSALLKRYVTEAESEHVLAKMDEATAITTALITRTEVAAALSKAQRGTRINAEQARRAEEEFLEDWADFGKVPVTEELAERAGQLSWSRELRAYDAVQLAAALRCQPILARYDQDTVFACFDKKLRQAARAEGLETWPA